MTIEHLDQELCLDQLEAIQGGIILNNRIGFDVGPITFDIGPVTTFSRNPVSRPWWLRPIR